MPAEISCAKTAHLDHRSQKKILSHPPGQLECLILGVEMHSDVHQLYEPGHLTCSRCGGRYSDPCDAAWAKAGRLQAMSVSDLFDRALKSQKLVLTELTLFEE